MRSMNEEQNEVQVEETADALALADDGVGSVTIAVPSSSKPAKRVKVLKRMQSKLKIKDHDIDDITRALRDAFDLRWDYVQNVEEHEITETDTARPEVALDDNNFWFRWNNGVMEVGRVGDDENVCPVPSAKEFYSDLSSLHLITSHGPVRSYCWKRLGLLEAKYRLYKLEKEHEEAFSLRHTFAKDFDNVVKVDTHIHHSACMSAKLLLDFMKHKLQHNSSEVVCDDSDGSPITLGKLFSDSDLTADNLSLDALDMKIFAEDAYHRFDRFNAKYNPAGQSRLREVFLKTSNKLKGRYLAELTQEVFRRLQGSVDEKVELRLSIYGRKSSEWDELSNWIVSNQLYSDRNVWMIQVPRIYTVFRQMGSISSFQDLLDNIFKPLFECTRDPALHPQLHEFLQNVSGFDSVDDESIPEHHCDAKRPPKDWTDTRVNPPYSYYCYYMRANISALNQFRAMKGLNTFSFRPHCGEAGDTQHLEVAFLLADSIAHGLKLWQTPAIQYLFYLGQIGIHMSPISNNALFLGYDKNPFPRFFARGLNVSLSTDDPCQFHCTENPLIEEYSVAAKVWRLSNTDQCEIALNSVKQCGFSINQKVQWIGEGFLTNQVREGDMLLHNVPTIRLQFRQQQRFEELVTILGDDRAERIAGQITEHMQDFYTKLCFKDLRMKSLPATNHALPNHFPSSFSLAEENQFDEDKGMKLSWFSTLTLLVGGLLIGCVAYKVGYSHGVTSANF
ncbi:uncharacterized protein LOC134190474 isoform X2 [Corticium candelabrum]|nr:uncharacterized protein LOC134190474 isoform X2 [Corticium candelabrum]